MVGLGVKHDASHDILVSLELVHRFARAHFPDLHDARFLCDPGAGRELLAVGAEGDRVDRFGVVQLVKLDRLLARFPEPGGLVRPGGCQGLAVRGKGHRMDPARVRVLQGCKLFQLRVPDPDRAVGPAAGELLGVRADREARDPGLGVSSDGPDRFRDRRLRVAVLGFHFLLMRAGGRHVPDPERAVGAGGHELLAVAEERGRGDGLLVDVVAVQMDDALFGGEDADVAAVEGDQRVLALRVQGHDRGVIALEAESAAFAGLPGGESGSNQEGKDEARVHLTSCLSEPRTERSGVSGTYKSSGGPHRSRPPLKQPLTPLRSVRGSERPERPCAARTVQSASAPQLYHHSPMSRAEEMARQVHHAAVRHFRWIFAVARLPGARVESALSISIAIRYVCTNGWWTFGSPPGLVARLPPPRWVSAIGTFFSSVSGSRVIRPTSSRSLRYFGRIDTSR